MKLAQQVRREFGKWLSLPNYDTVDIVAATLLANRLPGKAVWLALVGPPATGKTEIAQALGGCDRTHLLDGITPSTFASGYKSSKRDRSHHGLLDEMMDGEPHVVVVRDFSTVLQKRADLRGEILSTLRNLYDGEYVHKYGNEILVHWTGKLGMIVCSTGQYDKEIKSLATFGDRFMVFRPPEGIRDSVAERAARNASSTDKMKRALEKAYSALDRVKLPKNEIAVSLEARRAIAKLADFVTRVRSAVPRDPFRRDVIDLPELEGPARVAVQLAQLAKGLMLYFGRSEVEADDLDLMESLTFSTVPAARASVLGAMELTGRLSGVEIANVLGTPAAVTYRVLEDLKLLKIIECEKVNRKISGGWGVLQEWKPFVFQLKKWVEGR